MCTYFLLKTELSNVHISFYCFFICALVDPHEIIEEFLKSITSGLKRLHL
jgi:hypothetical protein